MRPSCRRLSRAKHTQHEADTLADGNEANGNGQDHGQQAHDLIQDTGTHLGSDDSAQSISSLRKILLSIKFDQRTHTPLAELVAGIGIEPMFPGAEPGVLPLHYPAEYQKKIRRNL